MDLIQGATSNAAEGGFGLGAPRCGDLMSLGHARTTNAAHGIGGERVGEGSDMPGRRLRWVSPRSLGSFTVLSSCTVTSNIHVTLSHLLCGPTPVSPSEGRFPPPRGLIAAMPPALPALSRGLVISRTVITELLQVLLVHFLYHLFLHCEGLVCLIRRGPQGLEGERTCSSE